MRSRLAGAHWRWKDGSVTSRGKIFSDEVIDHVGGAGAYGTARDFASVLLLLINEGKHRTYLNLSHSPCSDPFDHGSTAVTGNQVLQPSTVREMLSPQLTPSQAKWLDEPTPANRGKPLAPGVEKQWGLGMMIMPKGWKSGRGKGAVTWSGAFDFSLDLGRRILS